MSRRRAMTRKRHMSAALSSAIANGDIMLPSGHPPRSLPRPKSVRAMSTNLRSTAQNVGAGVHSRAQSMGAVLRNFGKGDLKDEFEVVVPTRTARAATAQPPAKEGAIYENPMFTEASRARYASECPPNRGTHTFNVTRVEKEPQSQSDVSRCSNLSEV